jgi:glycosyltransferase involved in cell wall biosynthesis
VRVLAVVSGQKWLGGIALQTALLCRGLERLGHQVAVVSIGADAVVDQFRHARTRHGPRAVAPAPPLAGPAPPSDTGRPRDHSPGSEYVFRYEVVADAARYLPPGPPALRRALAPVAQAGMALVTPPRATGRAPLTPVRGVATSVLRGVAAALGSGLSGGAEAPFLTRLLLRTDARDLRRLEEIRRWFRPDVEYACDLSLVPLMARLDDLGVPLVAAAQGFEIVHRRGVGLLAALRAARHRLDLVLSGSQANIDQNLVELREIADGEVPARAIPYGVAVDGGWEMSRGDAVDRMRSLERALTRDQKGQGGLWGTGATAGGPSGSPRDTGRGVPSDDRPPFVITCLSRIDVEKGTDLALHALHLLRAQNVPARLWIAGNAMPGSAYLDVLRTKIRLMDLDGYVSLIGTIASQEDKVALLRASDAFVAGFIRSEPFGLVYTEAFASELPVVAPATGAAPELMAYVGDSSTLYPANDTGALSARLRRLYKQPDLRQRLGTLERQAFLSRFNATEMAKAAAAEFEAAVRRRAGALHTV